MDDELLMEITRLLNRLKGYFVFEDENGIEFVVATKADLRKKKLGRTKETQLSLGDSRAGGEGLTDTETDKDDVQEVDAMQTEEGESIDDFLERINREIALYRLQQEELEEQVQDEVGRDDGLNEEAEEDRKKIRFEPLRGDLSPDLQE